MNPAHQTSASFIISIFGAVLCLALFIAALHVP